MDYKCFEKNSVRFPVCDKPCDMLLSCGIHRCESSCHHQECGDCILPSLQTCFCGKITEERRCGSGKLVSAAQVHKRTDGRIRQDVVVGEGPVVQSFSCKFVCGRVTDCGQHRCKRICHTGPCECPYKPEVALKTYACNCRQNRSELDAAPLLRGRDGRPMSKEKLEDFYTILQSRKSCTDPLPSCGRECGKKFDCGHKCEGICHEECEPCTKAVELSCRCGGESYSFPCPEVVSASRLAGLSGPVVFDEVKEEMNKNGWNSNNVKNNNNNNHRANENAKAQLAKVFADLRVCEKPCHKLLTCLRHMCMEICCGKKIHGDCDRTCGTVKACGNPEHRCELKCHPRNLDCQSCDVVTNEAVVCPCGKTVSEPPLPCGFELQSCGLFCGKELPCGHKCSLRCHSGPCVGECAEKVSAKCMQHHTTVPYIPCHVAHYKPHLVRCGQQCGTVLSCGLHRCPLPCHGSEKCPNSTCGSACGRKKSCGHICTLFCHGLRDCSLERPCEEMKQVKCVCGRVTVPVVCNEVSGPAPCNEMCQRRKDILLNFVKPLHKTTKDQSLRTPEMFLPYSSDSLRALSNINLENLQRFEDKIEAFISEVLEFEKERKEKEKAKSLGNDIEVNAAGGIVEKKSDTVKDDPLAHYREMAKNEEDEKKLEEAEAPLGSMFPILSSVMGTNVYVANNTVLSKKAVELGSRFSLRKYGLQDCLKSSIWACLSHMYGVRVVPASDKPLHSRGTYREVINTGTPDINVAISDISAPRMPAMRLSTALRLARSRPLHRGADEWPEDLCVLVDFGAADLTAPLFSRSHVREELNRGAFIRDTLVLAGIIPSSFAITAVDRDSLIVMFASKETTVDAYRALKFRMPESARKTMRIREVWRPVDDSASDHEYEEAVAEELRSLSIASSPSSGSESESKVNLPQNLFSLLENE